MKNLLALTNPIGQITPIISTPGIGQGGELTGLTTLINSLLQIAMVIAGIWFLINIILAGFGFMSASGDPKKVAQAWEKIWQSILGLVIIVTSFLLAAIVGILLFGDPMAILRPKIKQ